MNAAIVIPARLASTRLPRKLLLDQTGKTLIEHTYRQAKQSQLAGHVIVAADDREIADAVNSFGGEVMLTDPNHPSGTDRVAEVAQTLDCEWVINVQGDEPEISPEAIDQVISLLSENPQAPIATLATSITDRNRLEDPACVKVVFDARGYAIYFSRSVIPCPRDWDENWLEHRPPVFWQHIGLYGYRREFLLAAAKLPRPAIESVESLEQLRWLHAGFQILVGQTDHQAAGIDTPQDYQAFVSRERC